MFTETETATLEPAWVPAGSFAYRLCLFSLGLLWGSLEWGRGFLWLFYCSWNSFPLTGLPPPALRFEGLCLVFLHFVILGLVDPREACSFRKENRGTVDMGKRADAEIHIQTLDRAQGTLQKRGGNIVQKNCLLIKDFQITSPSSIGYLFLIKEISGKIQSVMHHKCSQSCLISYFHSAIYVDIKYNSFQTVVLWMPNMT